MRRSHALLWASLAVGSVAGWVACSSDDSNTNGGGTGGNAGSKADAGGTGGSAGSKADAGGTGGSAGSKVDAGGTGGSSGAGGSGGTAGAGGTGGTGGSSQDSGADHDAGTDGGSHPDADAGALCIGSDASYSDADIAAGMNLVLSLGCPNCHQSQPADAGLFLSGKISPDASVFPKNLTPDPETGLGCWTDQQILNAFLNGIDDENASLCPKMPRFAGRLSDAGKFDGGGDPSQIVAFLRSLQAVHNVIPESSCPPASDGGTDAASDAADAGAADAPADSGDGG